jgi:hypothetical protein
MSRDGRSVAVPEPLYTVPRSRQVRVIVDTDAACEADDQYAIVHALLTPKLEVRAITAEHFGTLWGPSEQGQEQSLAEARRITELLASPVPVLRGAPCPLPGGTQAVESDAARFIVAEALREDDRPLFVLNQGPLTNLASALLLEPAVATRLTAVWIGGGPYPDGGWEFNLINDIAAANVVMASRAELWQIPLNVYSLMKESMTVLADRVAPCGTIGEYLFRTTCEVSERLASLVGQVPMPASQRAVTYPNGEVWQLGDSPAVGVLLSAHDFHYREVAAPAIAADGSYLPASTNADRTIRVYDFIDSRMILEDFYAKLRHATATPSR